MSFKTIGELVELQRGTTYKSALLDQPGPFLLGLGSIGRNGGFREEKLKTYGGESPEKLLVYPNDLYVSLKDVTQSGDLLGAIAKVPASIPCGRLTQDTVKLIFKEDFNKDYFYWALRTPQYREYCRAHSTGTTNLGLSREDFFKFIIPKLTDERLKLTSLLNDIENKINTSITINNILESLAQALFKSWFVDFEPVKAKIAVLEAGGWQEDATLAAMTAISGKDADDLVVFEREHPEQYAELKATTEIFPSAMQKSELGEIPEGWKLQPFGELLSHTIGGDWGKDEPDDKHKIPVRIIRGTDIPNIKNCQDSNIPFRYVEEKKLKTRSLEVGDIVVEVSGGSPTQPTGRSIYITDNTLKRLSLPAEPASFCRLFRPRSMELGIVLALHLEKIYQDGKTWLYQNQSTGISNFQTKVFLDNEMVTVAPDMILKSFYKIALPFVNLIHSSENIKLTQLRDTLLPKLLSGEITLPEAEQALIEVENV
nr:restriction endonuclease subunit S [Pantoea vagans]